MKQSRRKRPLSSNHKYTTMKNYNTYTDEDYNSGDGFLTSVWGPAIWHFLHIISFNYPVNPTQEDKKHYRDFILSLQFVLPCKYCRTNLDKNFKKLPLTMDDMKNRNTTLKISLEDFFWGINFGVDSFPKEFFLKLCSIGFFDFTEAIAKAGLNSSIISIYN